MRTALQTDICETFRLLAFRTFDQMGRASRVGHQPLEETFTDLNLLELKDRHPHEIRCHTFNKPQEGNNGADWEWWLTDARRTIWLGMRIQAKVLHIKSNTFPHLHYKSGASRGYQSVKLKRQCAKDGLIPLYCFYLHQDPRMLSDAEGCGSFAHATESYGCSLAPMALVDSLRLKGEKNTFSEVIAGSHPWHCLVCCAGYGGSTLPERAWSFLQSAMHMKHPKARRRAQNVSRAPRIPIGLRPQPPNYVWQIASGDNAFDLSASNSRGVVVITPGQGN